MTSPNSSVPVHESPSEHVPAFIAAHFDQIISEDSAKLDESIAVYREHVEAHGGTPTMCAYSLTVISGLPRSHHELTHVVAAAVARIVHLERQVATQ